MSRSKDATRRALALLTAHVHEFPEALEPQWVWDTLGATDEERFDAVSAMCAMFIGVTSNMAEPEVIVRFLANKVETIQDGEGDD